jgi:hypothetical protein
MPRFSQEKEEARQEAICERKRKFASRTEANTEASRRRRVQPTFNVVSYPCVVCGYWHWARPEQ